MAIHVRELTDEERAKIEQLSRSRTAPVRLALRSKIIKLSTEGMTVPAIARELGFCEPAIRRWVCRFNERGLEGLEDEPRSGRTPTYTEDNRSRVIAKARSVPPKPEGGEVPPTCHWTLDGLEEELTRRAYSSSAARSGAS